MTGVPVGGDPLQAYQLTLKVPSPPAGRFDAVAAERGKLVFNGPGACASCHYGVAFTDANARLQDFPGSNLAVRTADVSRRDVRARLAPQPRPHIFDGERRDRERNDRQDHQREILLHRLDPAEQITAGNQKSDP